MRAPVVVESATVESTKPRAARGRRASGAPRRRIALAVAAAVAVVVAAGTSAGCGKEYTRLAEEHSANLLFLDPEWPGPKNVAIATDAEREVYEELGKPDAIRLLFNRAGDIYPRERAFHELFARGNDHSEIDRAWIYKSRDLEISFVNGVSERRPLAPKARTLLDYGDPHEIKFLSDQSDKWFYYDAGRAFTFSGEELVNEERFQSTGLRRF